MLSIQCETASFRGRGTFACRKCLTKTELRTGMAAVLMVLPNTRLVLDAQTGALIHDCAWASSDDPDEAPHLRKPGSLLGLAVSTWAV